MRLIRARHAGQVVLARVEGDEGVVLAHESGHPAADIVREAIAAGVQLAGDGERLPVDELHILAPLANPSKILAAGLNYADHARESGTPPPSVPMLFAKTTNTLIGPGDPIVFRAADTTQVDYEAELGVVIGRRARDVAEGEALDYVLGYTAANDVSARDAQFADGQWLRGKSFDTFAPVGPAIVTPDQFGDVQAVRVLCRLNGETLQDGTTKEMIFGVAELISYTSRFWTLEPGDLILTGTPHGVGFARTPPVYLTDGDVVEVEVDRIGVLTNPVRALGS
jgi:2-keto-4-pentenoate hydratase/2-oxohepta-3-ene-1,7-dioic acid hydratase in catechol pathway